MPTSTLTLVSIAWIALASAGAAGTAAGVAGLTYIEGDVDVARARAASAPAVADQPLDVGDSILTGSSGRAEISLPGGHLVWLDRSSRLDILDLTPAPLLRLRKGALALDLAAAAKSADGAPVPRVDTPAGSVSALEPGRYIASVASGGFTHAAVESGLAEVGSGPSSVLVHPGERTSLYPGDDPESPYLYNTAGSDEFARFIQDRVEDQDAGPVDATAGAGLPPAVRPYRGELERYGRWRPFEGGSVWCPDVGPAWRPYADGWWEPSSDGPAWVSNEPWGFVTYHYGNWDHAPSFGWYWVPGGVYAPAWVDFYSYDGYIGWSPNRYHGHGDVHGVRVEHDRISRPFDPGRTLVIRRDRLFDKHLSDQVLPADRIRAAGPPARIEKDDLREMVQRMRPPTAAPGTSVPEEGRRGAGSHGIDSWRRQRDAIAPPAHERAGEGDPRGGSSSSERFGGWRRPAPRATPGVLEDVASPPSPSGSPRTLTFREFLKQKLGGEPQDATRIRFDRPPDRQPAAASGSPSALPSASPRASEPPVKSDGRSSGKRFTFPSRDSGSKKR